MHHSRGVGGLLALGAALGALEVRVALLAAIASSRSSADRRATDPREIR